MNTIYHDLTVDLKAPQRQTVQVTQGDAQTRALRITLLSEGAAYAPGSGALFLVGYEKSNKKKGRYDVLADGTTPAVTANNNVLTVTLIQPVMDTEGRTLLTVTAYTTAGEAICTCPVWLYVQPSGCTLQDSPTEPGTVVTLEQLQEKIEECTGKLELLNDTVDDMRNLYVLDVDVPVSGQRAITGTRYPDDELRDGDAVIGRNGYVGIIQTPAGAEHPVIRGVGICLSHVIDPTFSGVTAQLLTLEDSGDEVSVSVSAENALGFTGANDHAVKLGNVDTPTDAYDAANKGYVDDAIEDNALMATKTQYFQASEKACARSNIGAEAARTDLSAAFAAQSDYATPQNFLAQQAAGRYVVDWMYNGSKIATCYADNDQPGGSGGVLLSRSTLVAYDGTVFRYVCCKSAYGSSDTAIYEQAGVSSSGTEFSKPVTVPAPTASGHAATKGYVDGRTAALPGSDGYYLLCRSGGVLSYVSVTAWTGGSY